jgi:hypothetical protein
MNSLRYYYLCSAASLAGVFCLTVLTGCGGGGPADAPQDLVPVSGVLQDGGKPVPNAQILFYPATSSAPSSALTDAEGRFTLLYNDGRPGAVPGDHKVTITTGMPMAQADGTDGPPPAAPPEPKEYRKVITVREPTETLTIELKG